MVTKGSVLVVDDEINLCRILGAKLAKSGYSVVAVHDGLQAVEKVRESDFDVVLLDLILPKMDGLTALAEIRSMRSALPIIVMTACENAEAMAQAKLYGVSAYVNKPFDLDTLVSLVSDTSLSDVSARGRKLPTATVLFSKDQPVTLEIQNGSHSGVYYGRIHDKDDCTLSVLVPRRDGEGAEIKPRCSVRVGLAAMDAYYSFTTHLLRLSPNPERVLVLDKPGVIYRAQRRESPRFAVHLPVAYAPYQKDGKGTVNFKEGETRDLSLGGLAMVVPEEVLPGEMLKVELRPATDKDRISAVAHVLRSKRSDIPGESGYILGCRFTQVEDSLRKLLGS
ncbi:MAG: response regulator [Armatimonadetes bacterium]|nr:response regulator [Armatimonadota bacterium]